MDLIVLSSVMLIARTVFATLMDSALWDVKVDFMEILVKMLVHRVPRDATETPAIVREHVQMTDMENSVIYHVVRVVQVDVIETLVRVIAAVSSVNLDPTVVKTVTLDVLPTVIRMTDVVNAKLDGKGINVMVKMCYFVVCIYGMPYPVVFCCTLSSITKQGLMFSGNILLDFFFKINFCDFIIQLLLYICLFH